MSASDVPSFIAAIIAVVSAAIAWWQSSQTRTQLKLEYTPDIHVYSDGRSGGNSRFIAANTSRGIAVDVVVFAHWGEGREDEWQKWAIAHRMRYAETATEIEERTRSHGAYCRWDAPVMLPESADRHYWLMFPGRNPQDKQDAVFRAEWTDPVNRGRRMHRCWRLWVVEGTGRWEREQLTRAMRAPACDHCLARKTHGGRCPL